MPAEATAAQKSIGPSIALKVKQGDKLDLEAYAQHESVGPENYNRDLNLATIATFIAGGYAYSGVFEGATVAQTSQALQGGLLSIFGADDANDAVPYAYLNYIIFDEAMNTVGAKRKRISASSANAYERLHFDDPIDITTNGFIYVWVSNETENVKVWFDDVKVTHTNGFGETVTIGAVMSTSKFWVGAGGGYRIKTNPSPLFK